jgi:predicted ArsR family transcriptional regulator
MPTAPNTTDRLLAILTAHPGSTVTELSELAGLGRSTVGKCLVALEADGRATRALGERAGARRGADHWNAVTARPASKRRRGGDTRTDTANQARLRKGELRAMVLAHLQADAGEASTPTAVAAALGRSAGAVSNAMVTLVNEGAIAQVSDRPRRFTYIA